LEEILEQLRELNERVSCALDLPTEDDLVRVEEEILISIPYDLRNFLLQASDVICGTIEPVTAADPRAHTYLPDVAAHAWEIGMPREYIPVCGYKGGYACTAQDGKVFFWQDGELVEEWQDFWCWCREVWLA